MINYYFHNYVDMSNFLFIQYIAPVLFLTPVGLKWNQHC